MSMMNIRLHFATGRGQWLLLLSVTSVSRERFHFRAYRITSWGSNTRTQSGVCYTSVMAGQLNRGSEVVVLLLWGILVTNAPGCCYYHLWFSFIQPIIPEITRGSARLIKEEPYGTGLVAWVIWQAGWPSCHQTTSEKTLKDEQARFNTYIVLSSKYTSQTGNTSLPRQQYVSQNINNICILTPCIPNVSRHGVDVSFC